VIEADGGSRGNPGPAGYGAAVKDADTGEVLAEVAEAIGVATNNVAEYGGLVAGLRAVAAIDPAATVEVRMDSKLVVEQMSGRWKIKHESMRRLVDEARAVIPPRQVRYTWVPRERNAHADRLANAAMDAAARGPAWSPLVHAADTTSTETSSQDTFDVEPTPPRPEDTMTVAPPLPYRLLTGANDRAFCDKVSRALAEGYRLHGSPAVSVDGDRVVVAQAVVLSGGPGDAGNRS
jgi:probable phosphoglycerate mutase